MRTNLEYLIIALEVLSFVFLTPRLTGVRFMRMLSYVLETVLRVIRYPFVSYAKWDKGVQGCLYIYVITPLYLFPSGYIAWKIIGPWRGWFGFFSFAIVFVIVVIVVVLIQLFVIELLKRILTDYIDKLSEDNEELLYKRAAGLGIGLFFFASAIKVILVE